MPAVRRPRATADRGTGLARSRRRLRWWAAACFLSPVVAAAILFNLDEPGDALPASFAVAYGIPCAAAAMVGRSFRKKPGTVLLLRPFGEEDVSRALKTLVREEISFVGVTFTLADQHFKPGSRKNGLAWLYPLGGPLAAMGSATGYQAFSKGDLQLLRNGVSARRRLAWRWLFSRKRLMVAPASDQLWREAIGLFLESVDLTVIDLSEVGSGSVWEVERLQAAGSKFVLISAKGRIENARAMVEAFFPDQRDRLFAYDAQGKMERREAFLRACEA